DAYGVDARAGAAHGLAAGCDDRLEELLGVLLDRASPAAARVDRGAALAEHLTAVGYDERLRRGRSLIDRENIHSRQPYTSPWRHGGRFRDTAVCETSHDASPVDRPRT